MASARPAVCDDAGRDMILLCTLGESWAVIPEVASFVDPARVPLLSRHPETSGWAENRRALALSPLSEIWVVTTGAATKHLTRLGEWSRGLPEPVPIRTWVLDGIDDLATDADSRAFRELVFRAALAANEVGAPPVVSLAGGRKTMSADAQLAGLLFGCSALVHATVATPLPDWLRAVEPSVFSGTLSPEQAAAVNVVVVGRGSRRDFLDVLRGGGAIERGRFPLPDSPLGGPPAAFLPSGLLLVDETEARESDAASLLANYYQGVGENEHHESWRSLYRLPPPAVEALRRETVGNGHEEFLKSLPKADLHRHLGGILSIPAQRAVARAVWAAASRAQRGAALAAVAPLLREGAAWPRTWPERLIQVGTLRATAAAALLLELSDETLERRLFGPSEPRLALRSRGRNGFRLYELPGELQGSALLSERSAVEEYARQAVRLARAEGLRYVELRGSPWKYRPGDPVGFLAEFRDAARREADAEGSDPVDVRFVVIADRRRAADVGAVVEGAVEARERLGEFVVGLDLAGDEKRGNAARLAPKFQRAFEACLPLTIHAGEGEDAESIWKAAYLLHADRIGHGLTLAEKPELARRFRDRGICLELCPTSNVEVVGYSDPAIPASAELADYPLRRLAALGLPLTICTDNPFLSRTSLAREYVAASRLSGGLSLWDALGISKQAFQHAFLPASDRERLLKEVDRKVFALVQGRPAPG